MSKTQLHDAFTDAGYRSPEQQAIDIACDVIRRTGRDFTAASDVLSTELSKRDAVLWWLMQPHWNEISRKILHTAYTVLRRDEREGDGAISRVPQGQQNPAPSSTTGGQKGSARKGQAAAAEGAGQPLGARESQPQTARPSGPSTSLVSAMKQARAMEVHSRLNEIFHGLDRPLGECRAGQVRTAIRANLREAWFLSNVIDGMDADMLVKDRWNAQGIDALYARSRGKHVELHLEGEEHGA